MRHYLEDTLAAFIKDRTLAEVGGFTCSTRWDDGDNIDFTDKKHNLLLVRFTGEQFLAFITVKNERQAQKEENPMWVALVDDYGPCSADSSLLMGVGLLKVIGINIPACLDAARGMLCQLKVVVDHKASMYTSRAKEMRTRLKQLVKMSKVLKRKR